MNALTSMTEALAHAPTAQHLGDDDLPWVTSRTEGVELKVVLAKVEDGLWILRNRFAPGIELQTHKHTGQVYAFTLSGAWGYRESEYLNTAGSFLYEPAGSIHTLYVPEENNEVTDIWFAIYGANLNMDDEGQIESVTDAESILDFYLRACAQAGVDNPPVLTD
jgi:2,4'-dihydroxyacetophenone dioxygenase